jgi:hypothetical protein
MSIKDGIDEEGVIEDLPIETHHCEFKFLIVCPGYLRVVGDNDFTDVEIRIPFDMLKDAGFSPPSDEIINGSISSVAEGAHP